MNIKEKIGSRIKAVRKERGLTVRQVCEKAGALKQSRVSNWEQGTRSPGPSEALLLGKILNVSPSYLLCLTDTRDEESQAEKFITLVPLFNSTQIIGMKNIKTHNTLHAESIPVEKQVAVDLSEYAFAYKIEDDSMAPEYKTSDAVVVDPEKIPGPGKMALLVYDGQVMIRKIRDRGKGAVDFVPLSDDWPVVSLSNIEQASLIGLVIEHRRYVGLVI